MAEESSTNFYDTDEDAVNNTPTAKTDSFLTYDFILDPPESPMTTIEPPSKPYGEELREMETERLKKKESRKRTESNKTEVNPEPTPQPEDPRFKYKQVILVRTDIALSPGKLAAQVAHASVNAFNATSPLTRKSWLDEGHRKIVLQVADATALTHFYTQAQALHLPTALIVDFGLTELAPNTPTTVAIGPALNEAVDALTKQLKLF